jgi:hypothetical protein
MQLSYIEIKLDSVYILRQFNYQIDNDKWITYITKHQVIHI